MRFYYQPCFLIAMIAATCAAQLPDRMIMADTPETLLRLPLADVDRFAEEASWMAVDSVAFLTLSLHGPRGDMPSGFPQVSPFVTDHLPGSGISQAKIDAMRSKVATLRARGIVPHAKVHEEEHDENVFDFGGSPLANPQLINYWTAVDYVLGDGVAIVDFEECQLPSSWVNEFISWWSARPGRVVGIHNHPSFEAGLFDPQAGNPNLGFFMLQISDTNVAHNRVTFWKSKIEAAGGSARVVALEPGPFMTGIPPDEKRSAADHARLLRQWGSELFDAGADGVGMYCGYTFVGASDSTSTSLLTHRVWFEDLSVVAGTRRRSIERYLVGFHGIADGLDLNGDGAVDVADLVMAAVMGW